MKTYTVHEEPSPAADRLDRAAGLAFLGDGFDWNGFFFAPVVLLAERHWAAFATYALAVAAAVAVIKAAAADEGWIGLCVLAIHAIAAFELSELRRARLDDGGWTTVGTVSGRTRSECERRFFDDWLARQPLLGALRSLPGQAQSHAEPATTAAPAPAARRWRLW